MAQPIVKFLVRRGTDAERQTLVPATSAALAQGELAYTTDSKRLFIGDGSQTGGNPSGSRFYLVPNFTDTSLRFAQINDIVFVQQTNTLYALTGVRQPNNLPDSFNTAAYFPLSDPKTSYTPPTPPT